MSSKKWFCLILIFGFVHIGWAQNKSSLFPKKPGIHEQVLQLKDFGFRYTISIPKSYAKSEAVPLILSLHYGSKIKPFPSFYGRRLLESVVIPGLAELGAIVIGPDSHGKFWDHPKIKNALLELLTEIKKQYRIDRKKVLLTGYSMGGNGTWHLVASHPQLFSAAIPMAGMPFSDALDQIKNFPLYVIHGQYDQLFPLHLLESKIEKLRKKGNLIELHIIPGITHFGSLPKFIQPLQNTIPWIKDRWKPSN